MIEDGPLERRLRVSRLYDLYGPLLTERQRRVYELHEHDDLSLSEISDELSISRQGVSDQLSRARERLEEIERLLGVQARLELIEHEAALITRGARPKEHAARIQAACRGRTKNDV